MSERKLTLTKERERKQRPLRGEFWHIPSKQIIESWIFYHKEGNTTAYRLL
jgi:hypothetical protein